MARSGRFNGRLREAGCPRRPRVAHRGTAEPAGERFSSTPAAEAARIEFASKPPPAHRCNFVRRQRNRFKAGDCDKLFQPFQGLPSAHDFEGTGVGLATVNRIVKRQRRPIWAEGEEGSRGDLTHFELPGVMEVSGWPRVNRWQRKLGPHPGSRRGEGVPSGPSPAQLGKSQCLEDAF